MNRRILAASLVLGIVSAALAADTPPRPKKPAVQGHAKQKVAEKMNRGLIARSTPDGKVYLGWRLLDTDPADVAFNVYRGDSQRPLNAEPLRTTTDFVDARPAAGAGYCVRAVVNGKEMAPSETASPAAKPLPYIPLKLDGNYTFQKIGIADLDGDGRYDFVIKQPNDNVDPYVKYWKKSSTTYKIEAYRHDGTFLWRHDMGWSIELGIWYSPYIVYDLDGDGCAEVAIKAGEGDPREADGRVMSGPEYLLILDGRTGKEKARTPWPSREGFPDYNLYCRNQLAVAYLDGKTPCLLAQRGTYGTIKLIAYEFYGDKLRELWTWIDSEEQQKYRAQGAHCLRAADVDGDGREEVILGSGVIDDNGQGLWTTGLGHPDHVYIGDLDPSRPGLEIYYGIEARQPKANGMCMVDAATGRILWGLNQPTRHVHGQGLVADLDPAHPGVECYSADTDEKKAFAYARLHSCQGKVLSDANLGGFAPRAAYWDADLQRELAVSGKISKYKGPDIAKIEGSIVAVVDLLGDWREEIITSVAGELRIYTTTIPAADRRKCLMLDPIYRGDVSSASQGYYQVPSLSVLPAK